jgi:hypothetical protein
MWHLSRFRSHFRPPSQTKSYSVVMVLGRGVTALQPRTPSGAAVSVPVQHAA